jgi:L-histidine N-alpha-methyltransferase
VYWPFDVCESVLRQAGDHLLARFPWLRVEAMVGDYTAGLDHVPSLDGRCLFVFLGGTFGNFEPEDGRLLLHELERAMGEDDAFLLGVDRVKDRRVIEAAYNDAAGVTAAFNRNVLRVLNRELGADFAPDGFRHEAVFNERDARIEMILRPDRVQCVHVAELARDYRFEAGQPLLTEISRKFTGAQLEQELRAAGLERAATWVAPGDYFSLELIGSARG